MTTPPSIPQTRTTIATNNIQPFDISENRALNGIITQLIEKKVNYKNAGDFLYGIELSLKGMDSSLSLMTNPNTANWRQFISKINNELRGYNIPEEALNSISKTKNGNELLEVIGNLLKDWIHRIDFNTPLREEVPPSSPPIRSQSPIIA